MELKPCPFCGKTVAFCATVAEIELVDEDDYRYDSFANQYQVCCDYQNGGCGSCTGSHQSEDDAIEAWNRRAI